MKAIASTTLACVIGAALAWGLHAIGFSDVAACAAGGFMAGRIDARIEKDDA